MNSYIILFVSLIIGFILSNMGVKPVSDFMNMNELLSKDSFLVNFNASSKKHVLAELSKLAEKNLNVSSRTILENLTKREKLGSTAVGNGIAIPHCRVPNCEEIIGSLITLEGFVDYDSVDGKPVDLIFVLIVPEEKKEDHIETLSVIAERFNNVNFCDTLRRAQNSLELYENAIAF